MKEFYTYDYSSWDAIDSITWSVSLKDGINSIEKLIDGWDITQLNKVCLILRYSIPRVKQAVISDDILGLVNKEIRIETVLETNKDVLKLFRDIIKASKKIQKEVHSRKDYDDIVQHIFDALVKSLRGELTQDYVPEIDIRPAVAVIEEDGFTISRTIAHHGNLLDNIVVKYAFMQYGPSDFKMSRKLSDVSKYYYVRSLTVNDKEYEWDNFDAWNHLVKAFKKTSKMNQSQVDELMKLFWADAEKAYLELRKNRDPYGEYKKCYITKVSDEEFDLNLQFEKSNVEITLVKENSVWRYGAKGKDKKDFWHNNGNIFNSNDLHSFFYLLKDGLGLEEDQVREIKRELVKQWPVRKDEENREVWVNTNSVFAGIEYVVKVSMDRKHVDKIVAKAFEESANLIQFELYLAVNLIGDFELKVTGDLELMKHIYEKDRANLESVFDKYIEPKDESKRLYELFKKDMADRYWEEKKIEEKPIC